MISDIQPCHQYLLTTYTDHGRPSSAQRNSGQKPELSEMDCHTLKRTASKNHRTAAAKVTAELNIYMEDPAATRTV
jgi:hypothetical protein